jgi:hypothetical protein
MLPTQKLMKTIVLLAAAMLLLSACRARELPFETIEKQAGSNIYEGPDPKLVVIANPGQAPEFDGRISHQAQAALEALDYERYFAIALFQGTKPTTGYSAQIESLRLSDKTITVQADLYDPTKETQPVVVGQGFTSPYHLVKVPREGLQGTYEFVLEVDGEALQSETRSLL